MAKVKRSTKVEMNDKGLRDDLTDLAECDGCGRVWPTPMLDDVVDLAERIDSEGGTLTPAGECPGGGLDDLCGSL